MTQYDRRTVLRDMLTELNAEWRQLVRESQDGKWARMQQLRSQRLALTAQLFELDRIDRKVG